MKWEMGPGALTEFRGCLGRTEERGQLGFFLAGLDMWDLLLCKDLLFGWSGKPQYADRAVSMGLEKLCFQSFVVNLESFTFIWSVERTGWRNRIFPPVLPLPSLWPSTFIFCSLFHGGSHVSRPTSSETPGETFMGQQLWKGAEHFDP